MKQIYGFISMFRTLFTVAIAADVAYFAWFVYGAVKHDWRYTTVQSCQTYVEVAKSIIVGAGIITSVLAGALEATSSIPRYLTGRTVLCLAIAIAFSFLAIMLLTRATEAAIARGIDAQRKQGKVPNTSEGKLTWTEFTLEVICGFIALGSFLIGILYLGKDRIRARAALAVPSGFVESANEIRALAWHRTVN